MDPSGLMGRLSKIKSKIEKSRFWHFLYAWSNDQTFILKYHFLIFSSPWGWERLIQTKLDTMSLVSWEQAKHFHDKDVGHWDTGHSVPITIFTFWPFYDVTNNHNCDKCHTIVSYSIWDVKKGENKYFGVGHCDQCPNVPIPTIPIWSFSEVKK